MQALCLRISIAFQNRAASQGFLHSIMPAPVFSEVFTTLLNLCHSVTSCVSNVLSILPSSAARFLSECCPAFEHGISDLDA